MAENQIAEDYKKNTEHRFTNLLSKVNTVGLLVFGVILLIAYSVTKNNTDKNMNYIIYAVLGIIILVLLFKPNKEKKILPRHVAVKIAQAEAEIMKREGREFGFNDKIYVGPQAHLRYSDDLAEGFSGPVAWDVETRVLIQGSQYIKHGFFSIHPYDGFCTAFMWLPFGFSPKDSPNLKIVPVGIVQGSMKTSDFGQPK